LVDANGVLLDMPAATMAVHHYSFAVVTGPRSRRLARIAQGRMALYGRLMAELDANNQHLSQQISEIDLTDPEDARVLMPRKAPTSWRTSRKTIFSSATSATKRTSRNGGSSTPGWPRSICVMTIKSFWRWLPE